MAGKVFAGEASATGFMNCSGTQTITVWSSLPVSHNVPDPIQIQGRVKYLITLYHVMGLLF